MTLFCNLKKHCLTFFGTPCNNFGNLKLCKIYLSVILNVLDQSFFILKFYPGSKDITLFLILIDKLISFFSYA